MMKATGDPKRLIAILLWLGLMLLWFPFIAADEPDVQPKGLDVESYCQIEIALISRNLEYLDTTISFMNSRRATAARVENRRAAAALSTRAWQDSLFNAYGTDVRGYLSFGVQNRVEILRFLDRNPLTANQIADLRTQQRTQTDVYEDLWDRLLSGDADERSGGGLGGF